MQAKKLMDIRETEVVRGIRELVDPVTLQWLDRELPESIRVPSGSKCTIQYDNGEYPVLAVRIQEIFGWKKVPLLGSGKVSMSLALLSPAYRPIQMTSDLESFWENTYPEVKRELQRKYPRHSWPENPLEAEAVKGAVRKYK